MSDVRATRARELHQLAGASTTQASRHRDERDQLVRALRAENVGYWTYDRLARAVGCSSELIATIIRNTPKGAPR